jgi:hypothetical protein
MENLSAHKLELARELVDDIELSRLAPDALLLKASRLARLMGDGDVQEWLTLELGGYVFDEAGHAARFADNVGRWTDKSKKWGYWWPLAEIEARIAALQIELKQCRVPDVQLNLSSANPNEWVTGGLGVPAAQNVSAPVTKVLNWMETTTKDIHALTGIRSRVLNRLHRFVATTYYELAFSAAASSIFATFQGDVDGALARSADEVLARLPVVSERLTATDPEAISHAMTTCRRIIDGVADALYPPRVEPLMLDGNEIGLGASNHLNRLNAFVREHCSSTTRRDRVRRTLGDLYGRVSAGVHAEISADEARTLFLQTYVTLGEIVLLVKDST